MELKYKYYLSGFLLICSIVSIWEITFAKTSLIKNYVLNEADTIENFDEGEVLLLSFSNQDLNPNSWSLSANITAYNSPYSLKLFGNTWKLEEINPIILEEGDVWRVSAFVQTVSEFQGFAILDSTNVLFYSFAGTDQLDPEEWITVYQGAFNTNTWNDYFLPVWDDWIAKFGYQPLINGIVFINNRDYTNNGIIYFDEVIDITSELPIAPIVEISYSSGQIYKNSQGLRSVDIDFTSEVYDPDSEIHFYLWDFGDSTVSEQKNPSHTFLVEDDHDYTVFLIVTDETNLSGTASVQISVDPGPTSFPVTVNFTGDIMLARRIEDHINLYGIESIFDPTLSYLGNAADVTVVNLESPLTNTGTPHPTKSIVFRGKPEFAFGLNYAGVDLVTLANNHIIDYSLAGLEQTQSVLSDNDVGYFGAGGNSYQALKPAFYSVNGINIAFLGASDRTGQYHNWQPYLNAGFNKPGFANLTKSNISYQINLVKDVSDLVVLEWHAGAEYSLSPSKLNGDFIFENEDELYSPEYLSPTESDIELRHFAIDEGADAVICHHPHLLQGFEVYNEKLIAHSLGNYIFDLNYPETYPTVILNSKINETGFYFYSITPIYIDDYIPQRAEGELGLYILDDLAKRSKNLNTYLNVDREAVTAEIILDSTDIIENPTLSFTDVSLIEKNNEWISSSIRLNKNGSISAINSISPVSNWQYRLGRELIWFGNAEDEGCSLWEINHQDEYYDTTAYFSGVRSLCQKRNPGLLPLNTNLEEKMKFFSNSSSFTIHSWIKSSNSNSSGVSIQMYYGRYDTYPVDIADIGQEISGTTTWSFYENEFSVPGNAYYFNLRLRSESPESSTAYSWFDNVGVIEWTEWTDYNSLDEISYPNDYYWLQIKSPNQIEYAQIEYTEISFIDNVTSSEKSENELPDNFTLHQNFPNPFNPTTTIKYELPLSGNVRLYIYNILGEEIRQLVNESQEAGTKSVLWNGKDNRGNSVSSGIYFYRLLVEDISITKKLVFLK